MMYSPSLETPHPFHGVRFTKSWNLCSTVKYGIRGGLGGGGSNAAAASSSSESEGGEGGNGKSVM